MTVSRHPLSLIGPGAGLPADVGLIRSLESSFRLVMATCPDFANRFYTRLFAMCPHLRSMFPADMRAQEVKLADTLAFVITSLRDPAAVQSVLRELGQKHKAIGVRLEHFAPVIACIVAVMGEAAGDAWTDELRADWLCALRLVAEAMMADPSAPHPHPVTR